MSFYEGGLGSGSGLGKGTEPISEQMQEFILSETTRGVLEKTPVIFGSLKEWFQEIMDERVGVFHAEFMDIVGDHTLSICDFSCLSCILWGEGPRCQLEIISGYG